MTYNRSLRRRILTFLLGIVIVLQLYHPKYFVHASQDKKRVLFISSYSESFETVPDQSKGIQSVLDQNGISLEIEYMDTKRLDHEANKSLFHDMMKYKLENLPGYDAVIVGDDNALQFAMDYQNELFPQIPIVFFGINDKERAKQASELPYMTGMIEETSLKENIEIAYRFWPKATKVVAIVDSTLTGQGDLLQFNSVHKSFPELEFSHINMSDYSYEEIGLEIEKITDDTILLMLSMNQDKTGRHMDLKDEFALLKEHAKVPVFRASVGGVGEGIMGGKMISYEAFGEISAQLVVDVLTGTPIDSIPLMEETPYYYVFDYDLIKQFQIDEDLIPKDAVLINKEVNPFTEYWNIILITGGITVFLLLLTVALVVDNMKRRAMQKELRENNEELAAIYEELTASEEELRSQNDTIQQNSFEVGLLNRKYENAILSTNSAVWEVDLTTKQVKISDNFSDIVNTPMPNNESIFVLIERLVDKNYRQLLIDEAFNYLKGKTSEINIQILANTGSKEQKWFLIRGNSLYDEENNINMIHGILLDITKMKEQELYIEFYARHDYLTNLPNRMTFMEKLSGELSKGHAGAVFLLDIDNFKSINDTLGHLYGDELLKRIAERLTEIADEDMMIARLGGDEFLVLISNASNVAEVEVYALKITDAFQKVFVVEGNENHVNFSMGITCYPTDSDNMNQLIMNADTAMYKVKHGEKNNYIYYNHEMKHEINHKREIEVLLRSALNEDGFYLLYQPQVETTTGDIVGFEALLRLKNYNIRPDIFIHVAEETGLIVEIGRWVAKEAIQQMVKWKNKGMKEKVVAINFSSKQLRDMEYINYIKNLLTEYQVDAKYLEIEITEGILLEKSDQTLSLLTSIKELGLRLALDDFGTGYSSINYLTYMPVDKIKLDKSINDKFLNRKDNKVIDCIILLAHSLNLTITAEGIEDWEKYNKLKEAGCDYIQGYLFSKPLVPSEIEKIYDKNMLSALE